MIYNQIHDVLRKGSESRKIFMLIMNEEEARWRKKFVRIVFLNSNRRDDVSAFKVFQCNYFVQYQRY